MTDEEKQAIADKYVVAHQNRSSPRATFDRLVALAEGNGLDGHALREHVEDVALDVAHGHVRAGVKSAIGFLLEQDESPEAIELTILSKIWKKRGLTAIEEARLAEVRKIADERTYR